jgi:hypothetical protein
MNGVLPVPTVVGLTGLVSACSKMYRAAYSRCLARERPTHVTPGQGQVVGVVAVAGTEVAVERLSVEQRGEGLEKVENLGYRSIRLPYYRS